MYSFSTIISESFIDVASQGHFTAQCAFFIAVVLGGTFFLGKVLRFFLKIPVIAGYIVGGIILGPSGFNIHHLALFSNPILLPTTDGVVQIFPADICLFFLVLLGSVIGVPYLLWLAGYETNLKDLLKVGLGALFAGVFGALFSIIGIAYIIKIWYGATYSLAAAIGLGIIFAATSVSIPVAVLVSSRKMHLKSSQATLGAAIVDDIVAVVVLSLFLMGLQTTIFGSQETAFLANPDGISTIGIAFAYMCMAALMIAAFGYFIIPPCGQLLKRFKIQYLFAPFATVSMLLYFSFCELVGGLAGMTGAYFAGLFHQNADTKRIAERTIAPFVNSFLLPLFLGTIGLHVNLKELTSSQWIMVMLLVIVAISAKLLGCLVTTQLSNLVKTDEKHTWSLLETYLFGSSMVARGEVSLVAATLFKGINLIGMQEYSVCVVVIVLTTLISPIMLSLGFSLQDKALGVHTVHTVHLGSFHALGTAHLFGIIANYLEHEKKTTVHVRFSEAEKIIEVEGSSMRIIFSSQHGISIEGVKEEVEHLLYDIKLEVAHDIERLAKI